MLLRRYHETREIKKSDNSILEKTDTNSEVNTDENLDNNKTDLKLPNKMTVKEIKELLDEKGVEYNEKANKAELIELLNQSEVELDNE